MRVLVLNLLILHFSIFSFTTADCPTGAIYDQNFNKCYKYVTESSAFYLAEQECLSTGGHLASVSNGYENAMISEAAKSAFGANKPFWTGGSLLLSTKWSWTDQSTFNYTNWAHGQPNGTGQCIQSNTADGLWVTAQCSSASPFVCVSASVTTTLPPVVTCPTPPPIPAHCPSGWTLLSDTNACYKVGFQLKFDDAESTCVNQGGHLASIHTTVESEFVNSLASTAEGEKQNYQQTWIGLHKVNNAWTWTDGSKVDFINWQPKQPDNDHGNEACVQTYSDYNTGKSGEANYHKWNDINCDTTMRTYVCKRNAQH